MVIKSNTFDVVIIGCGAAGLTAARTALARGRRVCIIDMAPTPARKVAASGGARCNFTNADANRNRYFGENPDFVRGALARFSPADVLNWARDRGIKWVEKAPGQYFCADGAGAILDALLRDARGANMVMNTTVTNVSHTDGIFTINTNHGEYFAKSVIVASGGISFPDLIVSDIGYKIARTFGHKIIPPRPGLCAIATDAFSPEMAGISIPVQIRVGKSVIDDSMLFTHFGIGGPAVYRATVRDAAGDIFIDMAPGIDILSVLQAAKKSDGRKTVASVLTAYLPARVARWIAGDDTRRIADVRDADLRDIDGRIKRTIIPHNGYKYHGLRSAEVTRGGVSTDEISSKTMESKLQPGLFFAGEVLDIAGDLGGFNLQWAWASGAVAGDAA